MLASAFRHATAAVVDVFQFSFAPCPGFVSTSVPLKMFFFSLE